MSATRCRDHHSTSPPLHSLSAKQATSNICRQSQIYSGKVKYLQATQVELHCQVLISSGCFACLVSVDFHQVPPTIWPILCFLWNLYPFQFAILSNRAERLLLSYFPGAQRRGNSYYFVAAKDDCFWQLLQQRGNSSSSAELAAGSFTFGMTSREETCCPPTSTLYSFLTAGQLLKRFSAKTEFEHSFITNS